MSIKSEILIFITFGLFLAFSGKGLCDENEYRLTKYLLSNYERSVRPVANSSLPINIIFGMSIHHIIDVDEKNQVITVNCWLDQTWNDTHLTWNASDFGGITTIGLPYDKVWRPDIILYNNADSSYNTAVINTNVMVNASGEVKWLSHGIFKSSCDISVEYFPFDIQICKMKWASWTYDALGLDLFSADDGEGDMTNYQENGEFKLESFRAKKSYVYYSCCPNPFPDITFFIELRRRPMFYVFNLILPCLLINGIALLVFYVPSESGEKVTLGISALLSMTVFLMTIRESLPPTEKTPLISLYYGVSICLVSFASAMAVVTLNIHHRGLRGTEVPDVIKKYILNYLSRAVFLNFEDPNLTTDIRPGTGCQHNNPTSPATASTTEDLQTFMSGDRGVSEEGVPMTILSENHSGANGAPHHRHGQHMVFGQEQQQGVNCQPQMVRFPGGASMGPCHAANHMQHSHQGKCIHPHSSCNSNSHRRPSYGAAINREIPPHVAPDHSQDSDTSTLRLRSHANLHSCCNVLHVNPCASDESGRHVMANLPPNLPHHPVCICQIPKTNLDFVLYKISHTIDETRHRTVVTDKVEQSALEWKKVSLVVDRCLLLLFFLAMTIASLVILTSSPHLYTSSLAEQRKINKSKEVSTSVKGTD